MPDPFLPAAPVMLADLKQKRKLAEEKVGMRACRGRATVATRHLACTAGVLAQRACPQALHVSRPVCAF